jgi:hypothetical protein
MMRVFRISEVIGEAFVLPDADQQLLNTNFSSPSVVLSEEVIERCQMINQRLKEEHDAWMETIAERYDELLAKSNELSKKCCRGEIPKPRPSEGGEFSIQSGDFSSNLPHPFRHPKREEPPEAREGLPAAAGEVRAWRPHLRQAERVAEPLARTPQLRAASVPHLLLQHPWRLSQHHAQG